MQMRVRLYRPIQQRRARCLLGIALLLPAAGFIQAAGLNPVTGFASAVLLLGFIAVVIMALRPVIVVLRSGILIFGSFGQPTASVAWGEIVRVESTDGVVSLTTSGKALYQIQVDTRTAGFLSRMIEQSISSRRI
jgi:hypothetical protein